MVYTYFRWVALLKAENELVKMSGDIKCAGSRRRSENSFQLPDAAAEFDPAFCKEGTAL